jgi:hypothetical protein
MRHSTFRALVGAVVLVLGLVAAWGTIYALAHDGGAASVCYKAGGISGDLIYFPLGVVCEPPVGTDLIGLGNWVATVIAYGAIALGGWTLFRALGIRDQVEQQATSPTTNGSNPIRRHRLVRSYRIGAAVGLGSGPALGALAGVALSYGKPSDVNVGDIVAVHTLVGLVVAFAAVVGSVLAVIGGERLRKTSRGDRIAATAVGAGAGVVALSIAVGLVTQGVASVPLTAVIALLSMVCALTAASTAERRSLR